jgi:GT2 family glycosyltransferase
MKITASIVLYKTDPSELKKVFQCFCNSNNDFQLFLIDNSPDDRLRNIISDERVSYQFQGKNLGYGSGHNLALRKVLDSSEFHLVLNSDISFGPEVLSALIGYMKEHNDVGLMMPKVLYPNGEVQYVCKLIPTPLDLIFRRFLPVSLIRKREEKFQLVLSGYDKIMEVPYLSGCFMLLRTSVLEEIGLFDERFFLYPEDLDLTRRINRKYRTIFYPEVSITHSHARESYQSWHLTLVHAMNMIKYFNKWGWVFDSTRRKTNRAVLKQL